MKNGVVVRIMALLMLIAVSLPWYSSHAQVDHDTYIGNPLPIIDWVVMMAAVITIIWPRIAFATGILGLIHATLGWLAAYVDSAEGIRVSILPGLPLATAASLALLVAQRQARSAASATDATRAA